MEERYLAIYDYLQESVNNNEMDEDIANAILEEAYDRYINRYTVEEALDDIEDYLFEDSIDYSLTTENVLDLMEYDILYEKVKETNKKNPQVNTKTASLVAHMKKYYKYYLLTAAIVVGVSAAIVLAKKKGDKKAAEILETKVKPEAEKIKKEAEKVVNENKEAMKEIGETVKKLESPSLTPAQKEALSKKLTPEEIAAKKEKVIKNTEEIKARIAKCKSETPGNYMDKIPFNIDDIEQIGLSRRYDDNLFPYFKQKRKIEEEQNRLFDLYLDSPSDSNDRAKYKSEYDQKGKEIERIRKQTDIGSDKIEYRITAKNEKDGRKQFRKNIKKGLKTIKEIGNGSYVNNIDEDIPDLFNSAYHDYKKIKNNYD